MITRNVVRWLGGALAVLGLLVLAAGSASAQTSTGTIRGTVTGTDGKPVSGAEIVVKNTASGVERTTATRTDGGYVLAGLVPATYDLTVRHIGSGSQARRVVVQVGATQIQDFALEERAVEIGELVVTAAPVPETRTSEVATNITQAQIEKLPTASRNFLDLAALAPGVQVSEDRANGTTKNFKAGGQSVNAVNIFIDGASLKNDLTAGGTAGQDNSRGNPFPRNSIQEYRVISQNFKAEYQKASSAIITATTKSGGNTWSGNAFFGYQDKGLVAADTFDIARKVKKPDYSRYLLGISAGGPIIRNKLHVFGSYEGNYQNRTSTVVFTPPVGFAALDTVNLTSYNGSKLSPFRETLLFGKLSYAVTKKSSAELSISNRRESDVRDFDLNRSLQSAMNFRNSVGIATLKYNYFSGPWLNEANVTYERFRRNPSPETPGLPARVFHYPGQDAQIGSNLSTQDFTQKRYAFRDDLTYSGFQMAGQHIIKLGATVDFLKYNVLKRNDETPKFEYAQYVDSVNYGWTTDPTQKAFNFQTPFLLTYGTGVPGLNNSNNQVGAYLQDDWTPTPRLTLNLGLRWDYESNMINTKYKTPQDVVDTLTRYNDSLPTPLDLSRYISTGSNRKGLTGAFQPRLGFSYALDRDNKTTLFGGFGIYYDRSIYDFSVDETQKLTHPTYSIRFAAPGDTAKAGQVLWNNSYLTADTTVLNTLVHSFGQPEAFLIDNKTKLPKSKQWSLGIRRVLGSFVASVTYQGQRGTDQFTYTWANIGLDTTAANKGRCCISFDIGAHGFRNFIASTNDGRTWYDALSIQVDRPYRMSSSKFGWGAGIVYTYAKRSIAGVDNLNDLSSSFPGAFPNASGIPKHADNGGNDERNHVVANWIMDVPYLFGIQFSGLITLGSGAKLDVGCPARFCGPATYINGGFSPKKYDFIIPGAWAYRRVDIRLRKDFPEFSGTSLGVTMDVYNVFNYRNYTDFDVGFQSPTIGDARSLLSDPRRVQVGAEYSF